MTTFIHRSVAHVVPFPPVPRPSGATELPIFSCFLSALGKWHQEKKTQNRQ